MNEEMHGAGGLLLSGFQTVVALWVWGLAVLIYGVWRSTSRPEPDAPRPAGPGGEGSA